MDFAIYIRRMIRIIGQVVGRTGEKIMEDRMIPVDGREFA